MAADVRSIDAVRDWHAALTAYGESLAEAMAGVELELRRAADWLAEQLDRWRRQVRDCEAEVFTARQELAARKWPGFDGRPPDATDQEKALRRAVAELEHAEGQVGRVRGWQARLPKLIDEVYRGKAHHLVSFLEVDLPRGLASLARRVDALDRYAELKTDLASGGNVTPTPPPNPLPDAGRGDRRPADPSPNPSPRGGGEPDNAGLGSSSPSPLRGGGRGEGSHPPGSPS